MPVTKRRIVSIDPGKTTGICEVDKRDGRYDITTSNMVLNHIQLYNLLVGIEPDLVICERFQHRPNQIKVDLDAVEFVGVVKLYSQVYDKDIVLQNPSLVGKTAFFSDNNVRVKTLGLFNVAASPHGMDALRHFLYYESFVIKSRYFLEKIANVDTD